MSITQSIISYLIQLPLYLVWLTGLGLSIYNLRRYPRVARVTIIAVIIFLLASIAGTALTSWLPFFLHAQGMAARQMGLISTVIGVIRALLNALAFGLLFAAIFAWRKESEPTAE